PGPLCVFGDRAFPLVTAATDDGQQPLAAAAFLGRGRIVTFGHGGFLTSQHPGTIRLIKNALDWTSGEKPVDQIRVGLYRLPDLELAEFQTEAVGFDRLNEVDVLILKLQHLKHARETARLKAFLEQGGGLIVGATGWGWKQMNRGKDLIHHFQGNLLLRPAGIAWTDRAFQRPSRSGFPVQRPSAWTQAGMAFDLMSKQPADLSKEERRGVLDILTTASRTLPLDEPILMTRLTAWSSSMEDSQRIPTSKRPIREKDIAHKLRVELEEKIRYRLPVGAVNKHPAAIHFPGDVPTKVKRGRGIIELNTAIPGWHSTGMYAAPGERIQAGPGTHDAQAPQLRSLSPVPPLWLEATPREWRCFPTLR
ncbi:MAG: hypothetical protein AAF492_30995, partial [Verrucomicrobiota bacterium]